jgi:uncharacterized protein DUF3592
MTKKKYLTNWENDQPSSFEVDGVTKVKLIMRQEVKMKRDESAEGRVVEIIRRREYVNEQDRVVQDYYFPVVEFVSSDGRHHSVQLTESSSEPSHEVGDQVTVLYNPDHPLEARIKSFGSSAMLWILSGITGILGPGFLGAGLAVRKFLPSTENPQNELA